MLSFSMVNMALFIGIIDMIIGMGESDDFDDQCWYQEWWEVQAPESREGEQGRKYDELCRKMVSPDQEKMMMMAMMIMIVMVVVIIIIWKLDFIFWPVWWMVDDDNGCDDSLIINLILSLTSMVDGIGGAEAVCSGERCSANRPWSDHKVTQSQILKVEDKC